MNTQRQALWHTLVILEMTRWAVETGRCPKTCWAASLLTYQSFRSMRRFGVKQKVGAAWGTNTKQSFDIYTHAHIHTYRHTMWLLRSSHIPGLYLKISLYIIPLVLSLAWELYDVEEKMPVCLHSPCQLTPGLKTDPEAKAEPFHLVSSQTSGTPEDCRPHLSRGHPLHSQPHWLNGTNGRCSFSTQIFMELNPGSKRGMHTVPPLRNEHNTKSPAASRVLMDSKNRKSLHVTVAS